MPTVYQLLPLARFCENRNGRDPCDCRCPGSFGVRFYPAIHRIAAKPKRTSPDSHSRWRMCFLGWTRLQNSGRQTTAMQGISQRVEFPGMARSLRSHRSGRASGWGVAVICGGGCVSRHLIRTAKPKLEERPKPELYRCKCHLGLGKLYPC